MTWLIKATDYDTIMIELKTRIQFQSELRAQINLSYTLSIN